MQKTILMFAFFIILFSSIAFSWDYDTHFYMARRVCEDFNCGCMEEIQKGSILPPTEFKDFKNYINYNPKTCKPSDYYLCPTEFNDISMKKSDEWINYAKIKTDCVMWFNIGIGLFYFMEGNNPFNQVINISYEACHKPFEDRVGEKLNNNETGWIIIECGEYISDLRINEFINEFERKLDFVEIKETNQTLAPPVGIDLGDKNWIYILIVFAVIFIMAVAFVV